jgi:hypothetical protein
MIQRVIVYCNLHVSQPQEMILQVRWNRPKYTSPRYKHMTYDVMKAHSLACLSRSNLRHQTRVREGGMYYVTCVSNTIMWPYTTGVIVAFFTVS